MFNFVHSCLTNNFINVGGVLSCVMALNIIFFHISNRFLADEADNTLVMCDNKIFRAPLTVENSSFIINVSFLDCRHIILTEIISKIALYSYEIIKIKADAVNK